MIKGRYKIDIKSICEICSKEFQRGRGHHSRLCDTCWRKEWLKRNPEKRVKYRKRNRERAKKRRLENPEKSKEYARKFHLKKRERVAGRPKSEQCEICKSIRKISFDHDHKNGNFRGWICHRCNVVLGMVNDNTELLKKLIKYIETPI